MNFNIYPCTHDTDSPAVRKCCEARNQTIHEIRQNLFASFQQNEWSRNESPEEMDDRIESSHKREVHTAGSLAYAAALPTLSTRKQVKDFLACVVHAMSLDIMSPDQGSRLIYGARMATLAMGRKRRQSSLQPAPQPQAEQLAEEIDQPA